MRERFFVSFSIVNNHIVMMQFDILTIFPGVFDGYLNESMIKRGRAKHILNIRIHDIRAFSRNRRKKVDDRPYGGGPGMVMRIEPIARAAEKIFTKKTDKKKIKLVLASASGREFTQEMADQWAKRYNRIVLIAGHYEGVDARLGRVLKDCVGVRMEEISIGPYTLTGGELPAMVMVDAVARHLAGFLGTEESLEEKRFGIGMPAYTRPEVFVWRRKRYATPKVLLSGNHEKIAAWRQKVTRARAGK